MGTSGGIVAGLAGRYATALFELARDNRQIEAVAASLERVKQALASSPELAQLTTSPLVSRGDAMRAVMATADSLGLDPTTKNFLGVVAKNRRLATLPDVIRGFTRLNAAHRGETTAEVTSAHALDETQVTALKSKLRSMLGRDVMVDLRVDPAILGGLVVRIDSRMIDSSLKTKLDSLALAMKG